MDAVVINELIIPLAGMVTGILLGLPIVRAAVRFVERKTTGTSDLDRVRALEDQTEDLRARVEAVETVRERLVELEERVDFAERMLTHQNAQSRLENH